MVNAFLKIRNYQYTIDRLEELASWDSTLPVITEHSPERAPLSFEKEIICSGVSFNYRDSNDFVLNNLDIILPKGSVTGLSGDSGQGKSSLLYLLTGLLNPVDGQVTVDGVSIDTDEKRRAYQQLIGLVSQPVHVYNATLRENIAFGIEEAFWDVAWIDNLIKIFKK